METNLTERNHLRQSPMLIQKGFTLNIAESDFIYSLLSQIEKDDEEFKRYHFTLKDYERKIGKKINHTQLGEVIEGLFNKPIFRRDEKGRLIEAMNWLSWFQYQDGLIQCTIDPHLKPHLLNLKQYVMADFREITKMDSGYSRRIYLQLKQFRKFGKHHYKVTELMDMLEVPRSMKQYKEFKRNILKRAVKDINKHTDIKISCDVKKIGRNVDTIIFTIKTNLESVERLKEYIAKYHADKDLYIYNNNILRCNQEKELYIKDNPDAKIHSKSQKELWEVILYNKDRLVFMQKPLIED